MAVRFIHAMLKDGVRDSGIFLLRGSAGFSVFGVLAICFPLNQLIVPAALAQTAAPKTEPSRSSNCLVQARKVEGKASKRIVANCRGHGLQLGEADQYGVFSQDTLKAVLVDVRLGSRRTIWLISPREDCPPILEDVSGQISVAAGRNAFSSLSDTIIDFGRFARDGSIEIREVQGAKSAQEAKGAIAPSVTIDFGQQIAQVRGVTPKGDLHK